MMRDSCSTATSALQLCISVGVVEELYSLKSSVVYRTWRLKLSSLLSNTFVDTVCFQANRESKSCVVAAAVALFFLACLDTYR